jgi:hypothetical protein
MSRRARRVTSVVAGLVVVALGTGACNDGDGSNAAVPEDGPSASASATEHAVETQVSFGSLTGKLPPDVRQRLSSQVGDVVDGWVDAAYVGGDYPRRDFSESWPGFTAGAQAEAHRDRALMSNEDIGDKIDGVDLHKTTVKLDVLAVKQHPVGVTARVYLGFGTTGDLEREVRVKGRLFLTHSDRGWQVFGYDVTKGDA